MPLDLNDLDKLDRIVRVAVRDALADALDCPSAAPIARKWEGGKLVLWPHDEGLDRNRVTVVGKPAAHGILPSVGTRLPRSDAELDVVARQSVQLLAPGGEKLF